MYKGGIISNRYPLEGDLLFCDSRNGEGKEDRERELQSMKHSNNHEEVTW